MELKYPKGETPMVSYLNQDGVVMFLLTKKITPTKTLYCIYEVSGDGSVKKLGHGNTPPELEDKYEVDKKICTVSYKPRAGKKNKKG